MSIRALVAAALLLVAIAVLLSLPVRKLVSAPTEAVPLLTQPELLEVRDETREAVRLRSGNPITRTVSVPERAFLSFSYALEREATDPAGEPYRFRVIVEEPEDVVLHEAELRPSSQKQARAWRDGVIDLSRFAGKTVRLSFRIESTGGVPITAYLGQGKITTPAIEQQKWNVLLITVDTLRKDHVSAYGYARNTTPSIDRLAQQSALFLNAHSAAPLTVPSVTSILTSTYFSTHLVQDNRGSFNKSRPTLADALRREGYTTAAFVGNAVLRPNRNLNAGFQAYNAHLPSVEINRRLPERTALRLTGAAENWLKSHKSERFFLWLHYQDPHAPYMPPEEFAGLFPAPPGQKLATVADHTGKGGIPEYAQLAGIDDLEVYRARYDGEIRYVDSAIEGVLRSLKDSGLSDRTLIVFTADHGESFGENQHYFAHGHNVTPELIDVPLILHAPGHPRALYDHVVSTIDIAPTILQLTGASTPPSFQGKSLLNRDPDRVVLAEQPAERWSRISARGRSVYEDTGAFASNFSQARERSALQEWIADHLSGGLVFAFSGARFDGVRIASDARFRAAYLFGGEEHDRITIDTQEIRVNTDATGGDIDYLFVEPSAAASIHTDVASLRTLGGAMLTSGFAAASAALSSRLPQTSDFTAPGVIVVRREGSAARLQLSREEEEELKSIGYVDQ